MPICSGCSTEFPLLTLSQCSKCRQSSAASSQTEIESIKNTKNCHGCGNVYPFLEDNLCNQCIKTCIADDTALSERPDLLAIIHGRRRHHEQQATQHRINRPQNPALQNATAVNMKLAALRNQKKADIPRTVKVRSDLFSFAPGKTKPHKTQILMLEDTFKASDSADAMLDTLLAKTKESYKNCPAYENVEISASLFSRAKVAISVQQSASHGTKLEDSQITGTVLDLHQDLKLTGKLSTKDAEKNLLWLRIHIYEGASDDNDEIDEKSPRPKRGKRRVSDVDAANSSPLAKRYVSAFRVKSDVPATAPSLRYDTYSFRRTTCTTEMDGEIVEIQADTNEAILIAQGWQAHIQGGVPKDGYIAKGLSKYGFRGRIGNNALAIFQCKPTMYTAVQNGADLREELRILTLADYFLKSFYKRAAMYGITLPQMQWNVHGAFIGTITDPEFLLADSDSDVDDSRSLIFDTFLAVPYLPRGAEEVRFCGNDDVPDNQDVLGRAVDAFQHHALIDSAFTVLLADLQGFVSEDGHLTMFDPQAHTAVAANGIGNKGSSQIRTYVSEHVCRAVCRSMMLHKHRVPKNLQPVSSRRGDHRNPLRVGWS